jgi:putative redox protein
MKATARTAPGGFRTEIDVNGRHVLVTDEPVGLGGGDAGPAPHELLPAAVAACVATMIAMYARTKHWDVAPLQVDVDYDTDATPRRVAIDVHLPETLTDAQLARLRRVAETCPIRRALEAGFWFEERIVTSTRARSGQAA